MSRSTHVPTLAVWLAVTGFSVSGPSICGFRASAQGAPAQASPAPTLAVELGYPDTARLLILHADDLGMSHATDVASFRALDSGSVNSASIMVPTPWVPEVAAYAAAHPDADLGLHLTLTSEWTNLRWGPTARDSVSSLLDSLHYLHHHCAEMAATATVEAVEHELRAQVEQALRLGIRPTHLDSHMGCLMTTRPDLFGAYLRVGRAYDLPVLATRSGARSADPAMAAYLEPGDMLVDAVLGVDEARQGDFAAAYDEMLRGMAPGVNVLLLHCGDEGAEMTAAVAPQIPYGAAWRAEDVAYFSSEHLRELLAEEGITLVTWRELYARWGERGN